MKYLSLDLETTGLGNNCQILQLAAVLDDTNKPLGESPTFNALVWDSWYGGESYALALNHQIFETLANCKPDDEVMHQGNLVKILEPDNLIPRLWDWLKGYDLGRVVLAGKNVAGFDLKFLRQLSGWDTLPVHHRVLDPGNLYLYPEDTEPPGTEDCLRRAGLKDSVQHDALADAYDVCRLIRHWTYWKKYDR